MQSTVRLYDGFAGCRAQRTIPMNANILLVDDDRELCALLGDYLRLEGCHVTAVHDADSALAILDTPGTTKPDLMILDVMMPGRDGLSALRELRARHPLPVLMLSARGEPVDRVVGLELGADDYLAKPCLPRELLARVRALLRRPPAPAAATPGETLSVGPLTIDPVHRVASIDGQVLRLTAAEYGVLAALVRSAGRPVDKDTLTRSGLGRPLERFDRSVDVHVSRLRHKLAEASPQAPAIDALRGIGYVIVERLP
jgi:two-component system response regulator CpxR